MENIQTFIQEVDPNVLIAILVIVLVVLIALIVLYYVAINRAMRQILRHGQLVGELSAGLVVILVFLGVGNICCPFMFTAGLAAWFVWRHHKKLLALDDIGADAEGAASQ